MRPLEAKLHEDNSCLLSAREISHSNLVSMTFEPIFSQAIAYALVIFFLESIAKMFNRCLVHG
jgi:hypothetical protein